jgi:hypothetical protein
MLYTGHFSFDELGKNQEQRLGYFTCIVGSTDVERALEAFKSAIEAMKTENSL